MPKPYTPNDKWSQRAAKEGFRARSVYKLMELDEKFRLLKPGLRVIDAGAAPGSWMQYASKKVGHTGKILGIDLVEIKHIAPNVVTRVCDMTDDAKMEQILEELNMPRVDLVLSDIAPNTTGIKDVDQHRSVELSRHVAALAAKHLLPAGRLVMKIFRGKSFDAFVTDLKKDFERVKVSSVEASRDRSREVYVVCIKK